jgi:hypothetical protein
MSFWKRFLGGTSEPTPPAVPAKKTQEATGAKGVQSRP